MSTRATYLLIGLLLGTGLVACTDQPEPDSEPVSPVLARVNGAPITERDVEFLIAKTFSQAEQIQVDAALRDKVLQSLVVSKAMQQAAQAAMSADDLATLAQRVQAYEEELFVQAYLQQHAVAAPVSSEMIETYYRDNPQQFGATSIKTFQILAVDSGRQGAQRDRFLADAATFIASSDWAAKIDTWRQSHGLSLQQAEASADVLDAKLAEQVAALAAGQTSGVVLIEGVPHLVRVLSERTLPAKPLSEVSGEIRKRLAPQQLRAAVKTVSEDVLANTQVEYLTK